MVKTRAQLLVGWGRIVAAIALAALSTEACASSPSTSTIPSPGAALAAQSRDPDSPYATTKEQFFLGVKACLAAQGFTVALDLGQNSITFQGPDAQIQQEAAAQTKCAQTVDPARVSVHSKPSEPQLKALYVFRVDTAACLRDAGYPVPDAPPEQVFIDSGGDWDPLTPLHDAGIRPKPEDRVRCEGVPSRPAFLNW